MAKPGLASHHHLGLMKEMGQEILQQIRLRREAVQWRALAVRSIAVFAVGLVVASIVAEANVQLAKQQGRRQYILERYRRQCEEGDTPFFAGIADQIRGVWNALVGDTRSVHVCEEYFSQLHLGSGGVNYIKVVVEVIFGSLGYAVVVMFAALGQALDRFRLQMPVVYWVPALILVSIAFIFAVVGCFLRFVLGNRSFTLSAPLVGVRLALEPPPAPAAVAAAPEQLPGDILLARIAGLLSDSLPPSNPATPLLGDAPKRAPPAAAAATPIPVEPRPEAARTATVGEAPPARTAASAAVTPKPNAAADCAPGAQCAPDPAASGGAAAGEPAAAGGVAGVAAAADAPCAPLSPRPVPKQRNVGRRAADAADVGATVPSAS